MSKLKRFFSDLSAMLFLGAGVSTTRTKQRKLDLRKLVSGVGWSLINRAAFTFGMKASSRRSAC